MDSLVNEQQHPQFSRHTRDLPAGLCRRPATGESSRQDHASLTLVTEDASFVYWEKGIVPLTNYLKTLTIGYHRQ